MKWSLHIDSVCSKAKRILGLLYRRFYGNTSGSSLIQLYLSLVRPHMDYASQVWDPHLYRDRSHLEDVQKFACRISTRLWNASYKEEKKLKEHLNLTNIPSLATRRLHLKSGTLYQILHGLCYFPPDTFVPCVCTSQRTTHSFLFINPMHTPMPISTHMFLTLLLFGTL